MINKETLEQNAFFLVVTPAFSLTSFSPMHMSVSVACIFKRKMHDRIKLNMFAGILRAIFSPPLDFNEIFLLFLER